MNGYNQYEYSPAQDAAQAAAQAEKLKETADYKRTLFILAVSVFFVTIIVMILAVTIFEYSPVILEAIGIIDPSPTIEYLLVWLQNDIAVYLPPLLIFGFVFKKRMNYEKPGEPYEYKPVWIIPLFLAGSALGYMGMIFTSLFSELYSLIFGGDGLAEVMEGLTPKSNNELFVMVISVGIIAPICEELIYRHLLLKPLRRFGDFQAVIITSVLFGFFHGNLTQFLYTMMIGFILGITAIRANSLLPAIILHMMNNVYAILTMKLAEAGELGTSALGDNGVTVLMYAILGLGVASLIRFALSGKFSIENNNPHLSPGERVRILVKMPSAIILLILLSFVTIIGTIYM